MTRILPRLSGLAEPAKLPPVARARPVQPAGEREQKLLELVDRFGSVASFARDVARRTKKKPETEKSAYYRIIRGEEGDLVVWRLRHYAAVLGIDEEELIAPWLIDQTLAPTADDLERLNRIVALLEEDPTAAGGELAPLLQRVADELHDRSLALRDHSDELRELSFRLRQAVARASER